MSTHSGKQSIRNQLIYQSINQYLNPISNIPKFKFSVHLTGVVGPRIISYYIILYRIINPFKS